MNNQKNTYAPVKPKTKAGAVLITVLLVIPLVFLCVFSFIDKDKDISKDENRKLKQRPHFSFVELFNGNLTGEFDEYYSDQFPFRDFFVGIHLKTDKLLTQYGGADDIVIVNGANGDDFQGEAGSDE